jgi:ABC-type uncharacterized transport system substrate-binding protein
MQFDQLKRREFITLLGGAFAAWPLAARAQQGERMRRIGVLMGYAESDREGQGFVAAFREGLQKLGWAEGRNVHIDMRWATPGDMELIQRFAKELVALQPDVILSHGTPTTATLLQQTRTIPIILHERDGKSEGRSAELGISHTNSTPRKFCENSRRSTEPTRSTLELRRSHIKAKLWRVR